MQLQMVRWTFVFLEWVDNEVGVLVFNLLTMLNVHWLNLACWHIETSCV